MKQFCRNISTRSKLGQKTNEIIEAVLTRLLQEELQVRTKIGPSSISGLGLFAAEDIPAGTTVFRWNDDVDQEYSKDYPNMLPHDDKNEFMKLASRDKNGWFLAGDGAAYFNHSDDNNVDTAFDDVPPAKRDRVAKRDIPAGEELTMNYADVGTDVPQG